ncbi:hypothetical protein HMPREF3185_01457 [Porphyromonas somerae]|uniref:Uncharacterized protein n=1 Tax=Porphyromonas somerae TaxID=322095 RepID=A0A134B5P4_9PORP|nr:hypothetical protein HMPREF3184_01457 [Porphyromonadaceae bacterium KA00676]KXB75260.1 hypothetical protein HMPREF3185_01457 [Porphyromonas somerae]
MTYIGQPSDQYRFTSLPRRDQYPPAPLHHSIYDTSPTELLRRGCVISPPDKGREMKRWVATTASPCDR